MTAGFTGIAGRYDNSQRQKVNYSPLCFIYWPVRSHAHFRVTHQGMWLRLILHLEWNLNEVIHKCALHLSSGVRLRQAGAWGPLLQCCNACSWTYLSSSYKIWRGYMELKITACMHSQGKFWTKRSKKAKNPIIISEELGVTKNWVSGAKAGYCTCPLHLTAQTSGAVYPCHPSGWALDTPLPSPHKRKEQWNLQLAQEPQESLAWISCLSSHRFLLMGEGSGQYQNQQPWYSWILNLATGKVAASYTWMQPWNLKVVAPWRKIYDKLSALKSRDITLPTNVHLVKAMVFPVVMYGCESWTIKKVDSWRIDAFKLWCWRRLLRVPWTARRSKLPILKEINPEYTAEGLMLKLKLQYFGHPIWRDDSLEKTQILGKIEGRRKRGQQRRDGWMVSSTQWTWVWANSGR